MALTPNDGILEKGGRSCPSRTRKRSITCPHCSSASNSQSSKPNKFYLGCTYVSRTPGNVHPNHSVLVRECIRSLTRLSISLDDTVSSESTIQMRSPSIQLRTGPGKNNGVQIDDALSSKANKLHCSRMEATSSFPIPVLFRLQHHLLPGYAYTSSPPRDHSQACPTLRIDSIFPSIERDYTIAAPYI